MAVRKYLPSLSDLLDRLSIVQLKEVKIPEHKKEYAKEIADILYDIDLILRDKKTKIDAKFLRALIVLAQFNGHIWNAESIARASGQKAGNELFFTHSANGVRNHSKNIIASYVNGRLDFKIDCLAAEYEQYQPSWT